MLRQCRASTHPTGKRFEGGLGPVAATLTENVHHHKQKRSQAQRCCEQHQLEGLLEQRFGWNNTEGEWRFDQSPKPAEIGAFPSVH